MPEVVSVATPVIATKRLLLRQWRDDDLAPFRSLNADPRVMKYFPDVLDAAQSDALAERIQGNLSVHDFGLWAVEVPGTASFIGFTGLSAPRFAAPFTPCVEIAWRLAADHWGFGYASEAAKAALRHAFAALHLNEVVSLAVETNHRSIAVMQRIGMVHDPLDDFDHPNLPDGHPLRRHVLYRARLGQWLKQTSHDVGGP